ncbi:uncharacterized protein LOC108413465 [Pygocentrus nattereri]|uniref:uncharacterized protein LOC108413465 n=1 Tax=Pygocentrus nattereri TaxID=42514 RepID=UPI0008143F44|nr:uncharacterized protein LOC108413465 [Pygocentrus nattereri]
MAANREWTKYENSRGYDVTCCEGEHVSLSELTDDPGVDNRYLRNKNIPFYPQSVLFRVSEVCHVTEESGVWGIFDDGGFQIPHHDEYDKENFLWWSLSVTKEDIADAEENFLEKLFPDGWGYNQWPFLEKFTTSPAFQSKSRYGNFRFTFRLRKLLSLYATQFCYNSAPVFRVLDTKIYKKEIMYSVLVHPRHIKYYRQYPRLPINSDDVCGYFQGNMLWRCQAPSACLGHRLVVDKEESTVHARPLKNKKYYVWDHVAVALYMEPGWVLEVDREQLYSSVSVCEVTKRNLLREPDHALSEHKASEVLEDIAIYYDLD